MFGRPMYVIVMFLSNTYFILFHHFCSEFHRTFFHSPSTPWFYEIVHHGHSPGVIELNSIQLAHRHDVALSGKSYGYTVWRKNCRRRRKQVIEWVPTYTVVTVYHHAKRLLSASTWGGRVEHRRRRFGTYRMTLAAIKSCVPRRDWWFITIGLWDCFRNGNVRFTIRWWFRHVNIVILFGTTHSRFSKVLTLRM